MKAVFLRAIEAEDKEQLLAKAVHSRGSADNWYEITLENIEVIPRSAFAYWVGESTLRAFSDLRPLGEYAEAWVGLQTNDDYRWLRLWWEGEREDPIQGLVPFAKGGASSRYYAEIYLAVQWGEDGRYIKEWKIDQLRQSLITANNSRCWNQSHYFRAGITWPSRTQEFGPRALPERCIFGHKGPALFSSKVDQLALLAAVNSRAFFSLLATRLNAADKTARSFEVGLIRDTPFPSFGGEHFEELALLASSYWHEKRCYSSSKEWSHAFILPGLLQVQGRQLSDRLHAWAVLVSDREAELTNIQAQIDDICFDLYGIDGADRQQIDQGLAGGFNNTTDDDDDTEDAESTDLDAAPLVASLISWAVGIAFGRFDLCLVTGERPTPPEPAPFDPLPVCSPGMLTGEDGLPVDAPPPGYPIDFPRDGILVDDPGASLDLITACRKVFDPILDDPAGHWDEAADILEDRTTGLRTWFAKQFFEQHIKRYSKSRRKAPIYWQLATPSASYSVWLYYHRFTRDTLFRVLNDHVTPKLQHEERKLNGLRQDGGPNPSSAQRKTIDSQETFVGELRAMRDEVARVAPLWNPNLNDGVILNFAPLWRLVPQHKTWQKECKSAWDKLYKGDYDWAHLAMHLWPERVVPKCAKDRSLAIAHGLEDVFWLEGADKKWQAKFVSADAVQRLAEERTSAALKDALKSLLEAPALAGGSGGGGRRKRVSHRPVSLSPTKRDGAIAGRSGRKPVAPVVDEAVLGRIRRAIAALGGNAAKSDIIVAADLDEVAWAPAINALLADGSVVKTGQKRGTRYHLAGGAA